jgi:hypothetical protein
LKLTGGINKVTSRELQKKKLKWGRPELGKFWDWDPLTHLPSSIVITIN